MLTLCCKKLLSASLQNLLRLPPVADPAVYSLCSCGAAVELIQQTLLFCNFNRCSVSQDRGERRVARALACFKSFDGLTRKGSETSSVGPLTGTKWSCFISLHFSRMMLLYIIPTQCFISL